MRLYKLLKDTPTIKAGTIFREVVSDYDGARELARVTPISVRGKILVNLYAMRLEKTLKSPLKKMSEIGRFILELRGRNERV